MWRKLHSEELRQILVGWSSHGESAGHGVTQQYNRDRPARQGCCRTVGLR